MTDTTTTGHGGKRPGAGRKSQHGEPTKVMRVPASKVAAVKALVAGDDAGGPDLDSLLIDVLAVADTLNRRQGGITKTGAADTLKDAVSDYAEVSGWDATEARQRDRERRRLNALQSQV